MKPSTFLRPSWPVCIPPVLLASLPFVAGDGLLFLRLSVYALLASPLRPVIHSLGWEYRDKPMFLTPAAAQLAGCVWAPVLYLFLCWLRHKYSKRRN
jgi:hypothetical protein